MLETKQKAATTKKQADKQNLSIPSQPTGDEKNPASATSYNQKYQIVH